MHQSCYAGPRDYDVASTQRHTHLVHSVLMSRVRAWKIMNADTSARCQDIGMDLERSEWLCLL